VSASGRWYLALGAVLALAACSSSGNKSNTLVPSPTVAQTAPAATLRIVGVGDSLTAGVQSGGLLGADLPVLGTNPTLGQIGPVQRTQEHGFFALLWEQGNGVDITAMSDPTRSPLPLIAPPGLGGLLAPTTSGFPYQVTNICDSHQIAANTFSTALSLRENPTFSPYDVGVPGQTVHEALYMTGPTGTCSAVPAQFIALNTLVNGESQNFWPILATFGAGVPQVSAAVSLHPQVATVWLGSNDLLKFALSNGAAPVTSASSIQNDIGAIVQQLQTAGAKVAVANLVDVMGVAVFIPQPAYAAFLQQFIEKANPALPSATAAALAANYTNAEIAATGLGTSGYFTVNALFKTLQAAASSASPPALTAGSDFVSDAVASQVKSLNAAYNTSIAAAVAQNNAALVDLATLYSSIESAGGVPINPPTCCSLLYGGGFFSLDGLHPSNTGYAILAKAFIDELNKAYGLGIPAIDAQIPAIYAADPYAPH
jgi:lysophospholipase L1-like esterase